MLQEIIKFEELNSQNWNEFEELIMKSQLSFPEILRDSSETYFNILSLSDSIGIIMLLNDVYIGNAIGFTESSDKIFLYNLSIEKEYQHNGYGYLLLEEFIHKARDLNYKVIVGNFRDTSLSLVRKFEGVEKEVLRNYYDSGEDFNYCEININKKVNKNEWTRFQENVWKEN